MQEAVATDAAAEELFTISNVVPGVAIRATLLARRRSGWWLLPAVLPLAVVPYAGTRSRRHVLVAVSAAPFYAAAVAAERW